MSWVQGIILDGRPVSPREGGASFKGHFLAHCNIPMHEYIALVRLLPRANVPAQCTQWTSAFATTRVMRPFAKLIWTFVFSLFKFAVVFACQIHADARNYECKQCGKAFKQRQGLRIHQAIHSVERPYKCEYCSKAFTQHSAIVRHKRTHTSARPYTCRLCSSTFNDYSVLRRHMIGIHKLQDAAELRRSLQAACAEARLAQHSHAVNADRLHPASSATSMMNTSTSSNIDDTANCTAATSNDVVACIPVKPDLHPGTSTGKLPAVLSQGHTDRGVSALDNLPPYLIIDALRPENC